MKRQRVLCLLLALSLALGLAVTAQAAERRAADFPDFDSRAWYAEAMTAAVEDGLLRGTDKGLLNPQGDLTRAEMAAIINRAFGTYALGDVSSYRDVSPQAWYYSDVRMAVHMGTYEGRDARTMDPDSGITRQEAMTVVARALQLDTADYQDASLSRFQDRGEVSSWALPYVRAMVGADYIHGNEKRELAPQDPITRAEFAQIFHNIIQDYILTPGTYGEDYDGNLLIRADGVTLRDLTVDGDLIIGCGAADGAVTLDGVTVTGRVVVWGGGTGAVWMNGGTDVADLIVCRVDGPVKVIFDKDSTRKVYDKIDVTITERAEAFPETEVIFYDISGILDEQEKVNAALEDSEISISLPAHLYATVDKTALAAEIRNDSDADHYRVELRRDDTGAAVTKAVEIAPGATLLSLWLTEALPYGDYPCTATVTALRDGEAVGTMEIAVTIHSAYLWNL